MSIDLRMAAQLFEVKKNQLKMIHRRGYDISREKNILSISPGQFIESYIPFARKQQKSLRAVLSNVYENEQGKRILVYYADVAKTSTLLGVNEVGDAISDMERYKLRDAVIITAQNLSPSASKHINGLVSYNIQIFLEEEMAYDPTEHFLVPKHIPLNSEEQQKWISDNNIDIDQMPIISSADIIARYYGLKSGQIVRIERENMFETMILRSTSYKVIKD